MVRTWRTDPGKGAGGGRGGERARLRAAARLVLVHACKQLNFTLPIDSFSATAKNMLSESTPQ